MKMCYNTRRKEWERNFLTLIIWEVLMKDKVSTLVDESIKELNVFVDDAFISEEEGKKIFNIVLDSDEVIDLNRVTEASRIINKIMDNSDLLGDTDELDIYSKEKGDLE